MVEASAGRLWLSGTGSVVTLTVLDPSGLQELRRLPFGVRRSRRARLTARASRTLDRLGVQLRIVSGRQELARIGYGVRGTLLGRLFALAGVRLYPLRLLRALSGHREARVR